MNTLDAALRYIRAGLPVLPLRGKNPATEHGVKDASLDEYQVRACSGTPPTTSVSRSPRAWSCWTWTPGTEAVRRPQP